MQVWCGGVFVCFFVRAQALGDKDGDGECRDIVVPNGTVIFQSGGREGHMATGL